MVASIFLESMVSISSLNLASGMSLDSRSRFDTGSYNAPPLPVIIGMSMPRSSAYLPTRKEDLPVASVKATPFSRKALTALAFSGVTSFPGISRV